MFCGTLLGGLLHAAPFLSSNLHLALVLAYFVVALELIAISCVKHLFLGAPLMKTALQVILGGLLVLVVGLLLGSS